MASSNKAESQRPLRILTIDNGGLQALSILRILKEVCETVSHVDGHADVKEPYELFDLIAGIGTGGWLAMLLGRYQLDLDDCMTIYIRIANALTPSNDKSGSKKDSTVPTAISQNVLVEKIERLIFEHELSRFLVDDNITQTSNDHNDTSEMESEVTLKCHAFAVGTIKRNSATEEPTYSLFRAYPPPKTRTREGPNPATCPVSRVCAATAASKDFLQECQIEDVTYWDEDFPRTHNISGLALDEAASLFDASRPIGLILNISPGLPTPREIETLRMAAEKRSSKATKGKKNPLRRLLSAIDSRESLRRQQTAVPVRGATWPGGIKRSATMASTASSASTEAYIRESEHQAAIRERLGQNDRVYHRLAVRSSENKPYLADVDHPTESMRLAEDFLDAQDTRATLENIRTCYQDSWPRKEPWFGVRDQIQVTASPARSISSAHGLESSALPVLTPVEGLSEPPTIHQIALPPQSLEKNESARLDGNSQRLEGRGGSTVMIHQ